MRNYGRFRRNSSRGRRGGKAQGFDQSSEMGPLALLPPLRLARVAQVGVEAGKIGAEGLFGGSPCGRALGTFRGEDEIGLGLAGATGDVGFVGGLGFLGLGGAPAGIREVKAVRGPEHPEIVFEIGESLPGHDVFQNARLDRSADGAEKGGGIALVPDLGGGSRLGKGDAGAGEMLRGVEAAESAARGDQAEPALIPRLAENTDDFLVGMIGAEFEDERLVLGRERGETAARINHTGAQTTGGGMPTVEGGGRGKRGGEEG